MNKLTVRVFKDADEASAAGFDYRGKDITGLVLETAVVVRDGTMEGNPTVDLLLRDEAGNEYVTLITGNLLKMLPI